jgi:hypothetical protein
MFASQVFQLASNNLWQHNRAFHEVIVHLQVNVALIFKLTYKTYRNICNGLFTHGR